VADPSGSPPTCPPGFETTNHPSLIYSVIDPVTYSSYHMECLKVRWLRFAGWGLWVLGAGCFVRVYRAYSERDACR